MSPRRSSSSARWPPSTRELLRDIRDAGSEVGLHTFTHPDLSAASDVRIDRELTETQLVLAGALGESSYLLRPPYSSTADAVDNDALRSFRTAGADGYVTVLSDTDSEDWQRPGVDAIVANSIPANGAGGVVLLHDAGGDRSQTVAALDRLIPQLQAQGYRFTTPETAVGLPADNRPVSTVHHLLGATLIGLVAVAGVVVDALTWLLLVVGVLVVLRLVLMLVVAVRHHRQRHRPDFSWGPRGDRAGLGDRPGLQREGEHRGRPCARSWRASTPSRCWSSTTAAPTGPPRSSRRCGCPACG